MNQLKLSNEEEKLLRKLEQDQKGAIIRYMIGGILICIAIVCLVMFIRSGDRFEFYGILLYGGLGIASILVQRTYIKYNLIIKKMKKYITELEKTQ